jgi:enoyl-CoA hydratase
MTTASPYATGVAIDVTVADHIAHVELKGPGKGNALGPDFWREAPGVFGSVDVDPAVRAVVLSGAGSNFSYGLDLQAMTAEFSYALAAPAMAAERTRFLDQIKTMQRVTTSLLHCRKPVIASISGWCIGAGLDIACAADVRVCSADALFSARAVRIGIVEDMGILQLLPAIVGDGAARELCFTGEDFDATHAAELGLVNHVAETPAASLNKAFDIAARVAANPPLTVQGVKQVMNQRAHAALDDSLHYSALWNAAFMQSRDFAEAVAAFNEKRQPKFEGR